MLLASRVCMRFANVHPGHPHIVIMTTAHDHITCHNGTNSTIVPEHQLCVQSYCRRNRRLHSSSTKGIGPKDKPEETLMSKAPVTLAKSASTPALAPSNQKTVHAATTAQTQPQPAKGGMENPTTNVVVSPIKVRSFPDSAVITLKVMANPKRPGTKAAAKWPLYEKAKELSKDGIITVGNVVAAFVAAKYAKRRALSALRWDSGHGFIEIK